jgi:branched-chain amino acid transport system permease protein
MGSASATAAEGVDSQAWSSANAVTTFTPQPNRLYVAVTGGVEEARTFVQVDDTAFEAGPTSGSSLRLHEADGEGVLQDNARVIACVVLGSWTADGERVSGKPPPVDCSMQSTASRNADGYWDVDLDVFQEQWRERENFGLALIPDPTQLAASWRIAVEAARTELLGSSVPSTVSDGAEPSVPGGANTGDTAVTVPQPSAGGVSFPPIDVSLAAPGSQAEPGSVPDEGAAASRLTPAVDVPAAAAGGSNAGSSTGIVALAAAATALLLMMVRSGRLGIPRDLVPLAGERSAGRIGGTWLPFVLVLVAVGLPLLFREVIVFKAGVVFVFFVAAVGLHVLVNWTGQVSLAHATMVGLPAFSVLAISEAHQISPIYLLPVATIGGALVGGIIALPTLRARDVQVILITLMAGLGLARYFFSQEWLVGPAGGRVAATPRIGPLEFTTSRSLYPVLLLIVAGAVGVAWALMHSKIARGWYWIRANPDAASAFGYPVTVYRLSAYAIGGAFAGLAGGLTVMWTQRLGQNAFPSNLSFTYLLIAVIAGTGFLGGVGVASFVVVGGPLFATNIFGVEVADFLDTLLVYLGPLALIDILARRPSGLNGWGRGIMKRLTDAGSGRFSLVDQTASGSKSPSVTQLAAIVLTVAGFVAIALAWRHSSETDQLWIQNQEMLSGGVGGLAAVLLGSGLLIVDRLARNNAQLILALQGQLERREPSDEQDSIVTAVPALVAGTSEEEVESAFARRRPLRPSGASKVTS